MATELDTTEPIGYNIPKGGILCQPTYCVKNVARSLKQNGAMPGGVLNVGRLNGERDKQSTKHTKGISALSVGSPLLGELNYASLVKIKVGENAIRVKQIQTGRMDGQELVAINTFVLRPQVKEDILIKLSIAWFGKLIMGNFQGVGWCITSMVSKMITALKTWRGCLENAIISNLSWSLTKGEFGNLKMRFASSEKGALRLPRPLNRAVSE